MPLYQLLGGKSRERVMVYGHATGRDIEACLDEVARHVDEGYNLAITHKSMMHLDWQLGIQQQDLLSE